MFNIKRIEKETIAVRGKTVNTIVTLLKRRGYDGFDWEDNNLDAYSHHAGICIEIATVAFSPKGRAISDIVITEPVIINS